MTDESAGPHRTGGGLPVVGGLLRRQRREAERAVFGMIDGIVRDSISLDRIVRRINIDAIIARLDIAGIVASLDLDALLARLDIDAIVRRVDINALLGRLDINAIVARVDVDALLARLDPVEVADVIEAAKRSDDQADL